MTHSFVAFIDESGSEGDPHKDGGFEFLVLSAAVFRTTNLQFVTEVWDFARKALKKPACWQWKSFKDINSPHYRFLISSLISDTPIRIATIISHKPTLHTLENQGKYGDLYLFLSQLLLERISWICRDGHQASPDGDGTARIIFSERKCLRHDESLRYADIIKNGKGAYQSNTDWNHIDLKNVFSRPHHFCDGLKVADFVASSFGQACEFKQFGTTDDRFAVRLSSRLYSYKNRIWRNGLKIFPVEAETDLLKEDRFRWLKTHCPGCI